jgi:nucleoid DNA-binding protein
MDRAKQNPVKKTLPTKTCLACGGTWFREVILNQYPPEDQERLTLASGREVRPISMMPMTVAVCLCGTPFRPPIGGVRGGHTPNRAINQFHESFACVEQYQSFRQDWTPHEQEIVKDFVAKQDALNVCREVARLERRVGRLLAPREGGAIKRGGHWRVPKRESASKAKGRDWLALEVQKCGLTFDDARAVVSAILDSMVKALQTGEPVETPLGEFQIRHRTKPYMRVRFGKVQTLHFQSRRVVFKAAAPKGDAQQ